MMLLLQGKSGSGSNDQGCPSDVLRNISGAFQIFQDVTKYVKQVCVSETKIVPFTRGQTQAGEG